MVDVDVLWGFLFVFIVFGSIWFVIFKGSLGGRFSGFRMVELKCICVSGVFYVISEQYKKYESSIICVKS